MASVGTYSCLIVFFFFSEIVMLSPVLAARNMGEASLLPPLPSSTHNFLEQCAAKLPVECGVEIVGTLFGDGTLTASCCSNLVAVGRPCHDEFLAVTLPYHKEVDPSIILAKSEKNFFSNLYICIDNGEETMQKINNICIYIYSYVDSHFHHFILFLVVLNFFLFLPF
ncbi:hypothetical protein ACOSQ2_021586 [Xanthoceras sorbifolium]